VVANLVDAAVRSGGHGPLDEAVGVVDEDLDARRSCAKCGWGVSAAVRGLAEEERCSLDSQSHDAAELPQLGGSKCLRVPMCSP
jgi:hypothetical protein